MRQQRVEYRYNFIIWKFNHNWHRDVDLPASYTFSYGKLVSVSYRQHDECHRTIGPAYIDYKRKIKYYYYQDRRYGSLEEVQMMEVCR